MLTMTPDQGSPLARPTGAGPRLLRHGSVIPAHPLALGPDRKFDKQSQRAISRYYVDAGSGGLGVGVHSTQFAIREVGLYRPGSGTGHRDGARMDRSSAGDDRRAPSARRPGRRGGAHGALAGLSRRAAVARRLEGRQRGRTDRALHGRRQGDAAGRLLPADGGGGIPLSRAFWARFAAIDNVVAIKVAPFNRYPHARCRRRHRQAQPRSASRSTPATTTTSLPTL
jgi:hypothetical protein